VKITPGDGITLSQAICGGFWAVKPCPVASFRPNEPPEGTGLLVYQKIHQNLIKNLLDFMKKT
jgi:hypothetical protein